jgi:6-pyruvoyltetrahydropterin/6-carboxytetrahydropterin synthase
MHKKVPTAADSTLETSRILVARDRFTFSAAHFARLTEHTAERLHGHNYTVAVELTGAVDGLGFVVDFAVIKEVLGDVVAELNQRTLLPADASWLEVSSDNGQIEAVAFGRRYVFPEMDVALLPVKNSTVECLAHYIAGQIASHDALAEVSNLERIEVVVAESLGQSATASVVHRSHAGGETDSVTATDEKWLRATLRLGQEALDHDESPFAAILALEDRELGSGANETTSSGNPIRHAEIVAIDAAMAAGETEVISAATLYSSCAPCPMCFSAAFYSGVSRIVYGARLDKARALGSGDPDLSPDELANRFGRSIAVVGGVLKAEADQLLECAVARRGHL